MYIEFRTQRLKRCYLERRERERTWGRVIAGKYVQAVNLLKDVEHPSDLRRFQSLDYHTLKANRKGQHALDLGQRQRLIFTVRRKRGSVTARIEEVSTTHYDH